MRIILLSIFLLLTCSLYAQPFTSTIRGTVRDADTGIPLAGASLRLASLESGIMSDVSGSFRFDGLPVGRYVLTVSYVGYEKLVIPEILLESGKESIQDIRLSRAANQLAEATVLTSRPVAYNSVQEITPEQTLRYAATYLDPARLTTSFAGVAVANDQANGLIIRGNSPNSMQWRLEGVEIVNPNHLSNAGTFSDRATQTGGGVNILSTQLMGTSYFLSGAFPAQYGNALSGVLDMYLRKGNDEKSEFTAQAGLIGLDIAAEGPFSRKSKASYLANYRYSFTGLMGAMGVNFGGEDIRFQDLSFNINLPAGKAGHFTFFGMGGISSNTLKADKDTTLWEFQKDGSNIFYKNKMGALGITHALVLNKGTSLQSTLLGSGLTTSREEFAVNPKDFSTALKQTEELSKSRLSVSSIIATRFSDKTRLKTGAFLTLQSDMVGTSAKPAPADHTVEGFVLEPFASFNHHLTSRLSTEVGVHYLYYSLTGSSSVEPRAALRFQVTSSQQLSFSYGLHSQLQLPQVYISGKEGNPALKGNADLGPSKSHHFVVGYQKNFRKNNSLKVEAYLQELYHIPVSGSASNSFSALNLVETNIDTKLVSTGTGRNYGIEATFQKYLTSELYVLLAGSVYKSTYEGSDGIRRDSRFAGGHTFSFTGGKEFKSGNSTWGVNTKILWAGGFRDTPIDAVLSASTGVTEYLEQEAFTLKMKDYFRPDLRIYWKKSRRSYSRTLAIDIQNVTGTKNEAFGYYDTYKKQTVIQHQLGLIPVLSYRWEF
ncbi:hypothetical protein DYBT9275_01446 [Dyadobacter sp. CECT 9275]|uniref:TonB-dependent receptor n=1 Tax=Dyadobacter helix TaxID=2822344 RepID=A0A916JA91_9BACT|nr:TonB-dependent receptor [Dyadobacter sp. CECT 9275]CAG4994692.1 hypothetical protein DYBT9275_01446 [Dyadobacter sp. CECT 9275]